MNVMLKPAVARTASEPKQMTGQPYFKSLVFFIVSLVFLWGAVFAVIHKKGQSQCSEKYRQDVTVRVGEQVVAAQTAKSTTELEKGLGGRSCLGTQQGMLFSFDKPGDYPFWMRDMHFPIDIVWLDSAHKVVEVSENISPSSYPKSFQPDFQAQYVLEINAGQAQKLGIASGTKLNF
ncbi:MAG: hypothetical protein JWO96_24 [Candidatus Saccharibacteria bacterium]|nr:hypothetical protein [Candidatus Saccharibacteria bacterium]